MMRNKSAAPTLRRAAWLAEGAIKMKKLIAAAAFSFLTATTFISATSANGKEDTREFASGQAGVLPGDPKLMAGTYFDNPKIRRLIYALEQRPATRHEVETAIASTGYTIDDLLRVRILREENGRFYIGFNYFTADDMRAIYAMSDKYVPSLVAAYQARKGDFERLFKNYPAKTVPHDVLAFALVAGFSLNWDGLKLTREKGWREPQLVRGKSADGKDWQYSFWAAEDVPGHSIHGYYWGSSTFPAGQYNLPGDPLDYFFSSFGDPYSDPRMNLPDLLFIPGEAMAEPVRAIATRIGLADRSLFGGEFQLKNALGLEIARPVGAILFALRKHPMTAPELGETLAETDRGGLDDLLALLMETGYVDRDGEKYRLLAPVFDEGDKEMFDAAMALSREIQEDWLSAHYAKIRADLSGLTALKQGVPYGSLFTQIWHDFFGHATHDLAEDRFFADPEGEAFKYKGSLPAVWRSSLYIQPSG